MSKKALIYIIAKNKQDVEDTLAKYNQNLKNDLLIKKSEIIKDRVIRWSQALKTIRKYADDKQPRVNTISKALQNCLRADNETILATALKKFKKTEYVDLKNNELLMHVNLNGKFTNAVIQKEFGALKNIDLNKLVQPYAIVTHQTWSTDDLFGLPVKPEYVSKNYPFWNNAVFYNKMLSYQVTTPNLNLYSAIVELP